MLTRSSMIILVLFLLTVTSAYANMRGGGLGGFIPITDLDDDHVQDIAKYAVTKHNQDAGTKLEYLKLVRGDYKVVAGNIYRLVISVNDAGENENYEAVVNDRPWEISRQLTSFNAV